MFLRRISVLAALMLSMGSAPAEAVPDALTEPNIAAKENHNYILPEKAYQTPRASSSHLILSLRDRRVYVYRDRVLQASYPVAIGKAGWETPTGTFQVFQMVRDPAWESPFTGEVFPSGVPDNPLGPRWIAFWTDGNNAIGFHGTPFNDSIGQAASWGCARMHDRDVVALFEQVDIGTTVTVVP